MIATRRKGLFRRTRVRFRRGRSADLRARLENISPAAGLGAEVVSLKGRDVISALFDFARERKSTRTIIGRTVPTLWNRLVRRSLTSRIFADVGDFDGQVVAQETTGAKS